MLFNEVAYLIFLPTVVVLHYLLPQRWRWALLLAASYVFYMWWEPAYALLILSSTLVDYVAGLRMGRLPDRRGRLRWLVFSLVCNLGMLFAFKYFNFFGRSLNAVFGWLEQPWSVPSLDVLLPVGISFYTFQTLSYTIEVYRGNQEPERHLGRFALFTPAGTGRGTRYNPVCAEARIDPPWGEFWLLRQGTANALGRGAGCFQG
jgi:D-alanyl-lipoteichoic acid acyltransferase DltB (MBOAT superfamily)